MARPLSPALQDAVTRGGVVIAEIDIISPGGDVVLSSRDEIANMTVVGGSITTDETRDIPGDGTVTVLIDPSVTPDVMPIDVGSPLAPTGNATVQVWFRAEGDDHADATPYGSYDLAETEINETSEGLELTFTMYDLARRVERTSFFRPRTLSAGMSYDAGFINLLGQVLPFSNIHIVSTGETLPLVSWDVGDNRLQGVLGMALIIGYRIDWNYNGVGDVLIAPNVEASTAPAWTFIHGGNAKVTKANRTLSDETAYNGVIISGESTGSDKPPVRAEAWDTDPTSPTYFDPDRPLESKYGPYPYFHTSPFAKTERQAKAIARSLLPGKMGLVERLNIEAVLNPGVAVADPTQVEREEIGVEGVFIVEATTIPLKSSSGRMSIRCRERRLID